VRLAVDRAVGRLNRLLQASVELIQVVVRTCGHRRLSEFDLDDLITLDRDMAHLTGVV